jgi:Sucrose synthase
VSAETLAAEALTVSGYLEFEEKLDETETDPWTLEVDLAPFNANFPKIQRHGRMRTRQSDVRMSCAQVHCSHGEETGTDVLRC